MMDMDDPRSLLTQLLNLKSAVGNDANKTLVWACKTVVEA
jgi:hypothetical protein